MFGIGLKRLRTGTISLVDNYQIEDPEQDILPHTTATWSIGSAIKRWLKGWFNSLDVSGNVDVGGNVIATGNVAAGTFNNHATPAGTDELVDLTSGQVLNSKNIQGSIFGVGNSLDGDLSIAVDASYTVGSGAGRLANIWSYLWNGHALPSGSADIVDVSTAQNLSGKTLTGPILSGNLVPDVSGSSNLGTPTKNVGFIHMLYALIYYSNTAAQYIANSHTWTLLLEQVLTTDSVITMPTNVTGTLKVYVSRTTFNWAPNVGPIATPSAANQTWTLEKDAFGIVTAYIPTLANISQTSGTAFHMVAGSIPVGYRPLNSGVSNVTGAAMILNNNGGTIGAFSVRTDGEVYLGGSISVGAFAGTGTVGWPGQTIKWSTL